MVELTNLSTEELRSRILTIRKICLTSTELSSHFLDLKIREATLVHQELERRKNENIIKVIDMLSKIKTLIRIDSYANKMKMEHKHFKALDFISAIESKAFCNNDYMLLVKNWYTEGKSSVLRESILRPLNYNNDNVIEFSAFALLDECMQKLKKNEWLIF
jgi:hypothetical protein